MLNDGAWNGQPCFIVAGGPSLKRFTFRLLAGVPRVIAINAAFVDVPTADVFITEDARVIEFAAPGTEWKSFHGVKIFACPDDGYVETVKRIAPEVEIVRSRPKSKGWSKRLADGLSTSSCSLIPALNLADILGADPICLLGVDLGDDASNYHGRYPSDWKSGASQMASFRSDVEHWAAVHLRHRRVVNLNRDSAVSCWPKTQRGYDDAVAAILRDGAGALANA